VGIYDKPTKTEESLENQNKIMFMKNLTKKFGTNTAVDNLSIKM
jgi:hypothetical protein